MRGVREDSAEPVCDWCGMSLPLSRAMARVVRMSFGPLYCPTCSPINHYQFAVSDIEAEIREGDAGNGHDGSAEYATAE
jgi:hypothetical protein